MLDIKFIRENADAVKRAAVDKRIKCDVDRLIAVEVGYADALPVDVPGATSSRHPASVIHRPLVDPIPDQAEFSG